MDGYYLECFEVRSHRCAYVFSVFSHLCECLALILPHRVILITICIEEQCISNAVEILELNQIYIERYVKKKRIEISNSHFGILIVEVYIF